MASYISFKEAHGLLMEGPPAVALQTACLLLQAQKLLTDGVDSFTETVKNSLELMLATAEDLPCHAQHPHTAAATCYLLDLVQAALQQAPQPYQNGNPQNVAWLQKHLPGVTAAVQDCLSSQLVIITKRLSILQSLVSQQQVSNAQMQARASAECTTHVMLLDMYLLLILVSPVESLCTGMQWPNKSEQDCADSKDRHYHQRQRLHRGNELINNVGFSLQQQAEVRAKQLQQLETVKGGVKELGMLTAVAYQKVTARTEPAFSVWCDASVMWLMLASQLPPGHRALADFLLPIDWRFLLVHKSNSKQGRALLQPLLCEVLGAYKLLSRFDEPGQLGILPLLIRFMQFPADTVQEAGPLAAQVQLLQSWLADAASGHKSDVKEVPTVSYSDQQAGRLHTAGSTSAAEISQRGADGGKTLAATDNKDSEALGGNADDELNDMHALLRQMYGCLVSVEVAQAGPTGTHARTASSSSSSSSSCGSSSGAGNGLRAVESGSSLTTDAAVQADHTGIHTEIPVLAFGSALQQRL